MEQKPTTESKTFNQEYRDKLAEELREQRANGNSEKAKDTLSHEQGGVFYDKAKQTHQEGDQLKVRASSSEERIKKLIEEHNNKFNTSLEFSKEEKEIQDAIKAVEEMGAEVSEIEGRIADSENTEEDVKNLEESKKGFENESSKILDKVESKINESSEVAPEKTFTDEQAKQLAVERNIAKAKLENGEITQEQYQEKYDAWREAYDYGLGKEADEPKESFSVNESGEILRPNYKEDAEENKTFNAGDAVYWGKDAKISDDPSLKDDFDAAAEKYKKSQESDVEDDGFGQDPTPEEIKAMIDRANADTAREKAEKEALENNVKRGMFAGIIASAMKSLAWMRGKNSPWTTDSMIIREEMKIKDARRKLDQMEKGINPEEKEKNIEKITPAVLLVGLEERNDTLKKDKKAMGWWERNKSKVKRGLLGLGLLGALYFLPNKCTNNEGLPKDNTEIVTPTPENKAEEIISQKVVNKAGYGPTQILEAALWQNKEMRDLANLPTPMLTPDLFKELGEKIHVIDSSGNEIRLKGEVIGGISEVVYNKDSGFTLIIDNKNGKTVDVRHEGEIGITNHGPTKAEYASTKGGKTISWEDANNLNK